MSCFCSGINGTRNTGLEATGSYFCTISPRVGPLKVGVKISGPLGRQRGLRVQKVPKDFHAPTRQLVQLTKRSQVGGALRIIRRAIVAWNWSRS